MTDPLKVIALGGQPEWSHEYDHPRWGKITFRAQLPTARKLMEQSVAMDNLLAELGFNVEARGGTTILAAAITGLIHIIDRPVVDKVPVVDDDGSGHEVFKQVLYDPLEETNTSFVVTVWRDFWEWRQDQIERVDELGNSSGETSGNESSESSTATTASPSMTPA